MTSLLPQYLKEQHSISSASLSLDDLYLPHDKLVQLANDNPTNRMWQGRGQPGTHDLELGVSCLEALAKGEQVDLPVYDKSRFDGQGDRSEETIRVTGAVDIVLFEGWMTGFASLPSKELENRFETAKADPKAFARRHLDYDEPFFLHHDLEHLQSVNKVLQDYAPLWNYIDCFIQLKPESMTYVWDWRLEQEHNMMAKNGGKGMTDDQVRRFIERYMPGYELFLEGVRAQGTRWKTKGMQLVLSKTRDIVQSTPF